MKENNIIHHTYQLKEKWAYQVVIKYLHHSTSIVDIKQEITAKGHKVRNIINGKQRQSKEPLNLFFVNLEPGEHNKEIYKINKVHNSNRGTKKRQEYYPAYEMPVIWSLKDLYCNRPFLCVKCARNHSTPKL